MTAALIEIPITDISALSAPPPIVAVPLTILCKNSNKRYDADEYYKCHHNEKDDIKKVERFLSWLHNYSGLIDTFIGRRLLTAFAEATRKIPITPVWCGCSDILSRRHYIPICRRCDQCRAMRNGDTDLFFGKLLQKRNYQLFILRIKRRGRLVKNNQFCILQECSRNCDPLLLPIGKERIFLHRCFVCKLPLFDKCICTSLFGCSIHFL